MFQAAIHFQTKKHHYSIDLNRFLFALFCLIVYGILLYVFFIDLPLHPWKYFINGGIHKI